MSESAAAAEHLKMIRGMMERATIYRAISAPAAIFGGVLAILAGGYFIWCEHRNAPATATEYFWIWVGVLLLVYVFNTLLLWRRAKAEREPFFSSGMRHVCLVFGPAMLAGGLISHEVVTKHSDFELCSLVWILCYAAALLAMGGVAPRSLRRLGWAFLSAGLVFFVVPKCTGKPIGEMLGLRQLGTASAMMIITFGLMHLGHGAGVLLRKGKTNGEPA